MKLSQSIIIQLINSGLIRAKIEILTIRILVMNEICITMKAKNCMLRKWQ